MQNISSFIDYSLLHLPSNHCSEERKERGVLIARGAINGNKAGYTATLVACGWAGAVMEKVTGAFGQVQ